MLDVRMGAGARLRVPIPASYNALAVVAQGRSNAGRFAAGAGELVLFKNDAASLELACEEDTHVIVLAGEPIDEPIVQYGPFVMNTVEEIEQAITDVEIGKFGSVPET
jgi:hypothetical protein